MADLLQNLRNIAGNIFSLRPFESGETIAGPDWPDWLWTLANPELILQVLLVFILLLLGRYIYDLVTPFSLSEVLTTSDNKALSLSFASYCGGLVIVIAGVYNSDSAELNAALPYWRYLLYSLGDTFLWGAIGICLLLLAQGLNNRFILSQFDNYQQIVGQRNLAAGIAEGASYLASALLIYAVMQGGSPSLIIDLLLTIFYFVLGQLAQILYSRVFISLRRKARNFSWDFQREIGRQNSAAAISFAFSLLSFALLLAGYIANFFSFYGYLLAIVLSILYLGLLHFLIDQLFFPKVSLRREIAQDGNWGAALIEGVLLLGISGISVIAFSFYFA